MASPIYEFFAKVTLDSSEMENALGKIGTAAKSGLAAVGTAVTTAVAAVGAVSTALVKGTMDVASYGDTIDKMSQKMGMSAEAYQEWDAVMQHSGTSMEAMKSSMKTLANAVETGSDAFEKLGISEQELASLNQEQLFSRTIEALQNVEDETERTYLAGKVLGKGATELGAFLNTSAEDVQAMKDRVHELGGVMSNEAVKDAAKFQDSLQDMKTAFSGIGRGLLTNFMPSITKAMDGLTEIFGGDSSKGMQMLKSGISDFVQKLADTAPQFIELVGNILTAIAENLPTLISSLLPVIIKSLGQIVAQLVISLPEILSSIWDALKQIFVDIFASLKEFLPEEAQGTFSVISDAFAGVWEYCKVWWDSIGKPIWDAIQYAVGLVVDAFKADMPAIGDTVSETFGNIKDLWETALKPAFAAIKNFLETTLKPVFEFVFKNAIWPTVQAVFKFIADLLNNSFIPVLKGVIQFLTGVFTGDWKKAFEGLNNICKGVFNGIVSGVEYMVNGVINGINFMLEAINTVANKAGEKLGFDPINLHINPISLPRLAKGGLIAGDGSAIVGEAGAELVELPHGATVTPINDNNSRLLSMLSSIEDMLQQYLPEQGAGTVVLDTGALVGQLVNPMDRALGRVQSTRLRGAMA